MMASRKQILMKDVIARALSYRMRYRPDVPYPSFASSMVYRLCRNHELFEAGWIDRAKVVINAIDRKYRLPLIIAKQEIDFQERIYSFDPIFSENFISKVNVENALRAATSGLGEQFAREGFGIDDGFLLECVNAARDRRGLPAI